MRYISEIIRTAIAYDGFWTWNAKPRIVRSKEFIEKGEYLPTFSFLNTLKNLSTNCLINIIRDCVGFLQQPVFFVRAFGSHENRSLPFLVYVVMERLKHIRRCENMVENFSIGDCFAVSQQMCRRASDFNKKQI